MDTEESRAYTWTGKGGTIYVITSDVNGDGALYTESEDVTGTPYLRPVGEKDVAYADMVGLILRSLGKP